MKCIMYQNCGLKRTSMMILAVSGAPREIAGKAWEIQAWIFQAFLATAQVTLKRLILKKKISWVQRTHWLCRWNFWFLVVSTFDERQNSEVNTCIRGAQSFPKESQ